MKVLFVCLGNICRSPLAEAIFNHRVAIKGLNNYFSADSCGTASYEVGDPPDPHTIRNALKNGVTINHRARQFEAEDFTRFDLILAMDGSNYANLLRLPSAGKYLDKIKLMRTFDSINPGEDVPDPYHCPEEDFQDVFAILDRSVNGLLTHLEVQPGIANRR